MTEYAPETTTRSAPLESDESLEIEFRPKNPGPVSIGVHAPWDRLIPPDPTRRRLELVAPDRNDPVATSESRGFFSNTALDFSVTEAALTTPGEWRARVVNIERMEGTETFELTVSYPSDTEIMTAEVDAFDLENQLFGLFKSSEITLTSGDDRSVVRLPNVSVENYRFTVPGLDEEVHSAGGHRIVRERLYELTAQLARVTLDGGTINLLFEFEEPNYDFVGDLDVRMLRPQIHVTFPLGTTEQAVVTGSPKAVFDFEVDSDTDVPAPVRWAIEDFADELRNRVTEELSVAFDRGRIHEYIDDVLATEVDNAVPEDASIYGIGRVAQGNFNVKYVVD
jgi:hypothetical protein